MTVGGSGAAAEPATGRLASILLAAALLLGLVWVGFAPALDAEVLHFDDDQALTLNPHFRGLRGEHLSWMLTTPRLGHYQPLTWLSFALDWSAEESIDAARFHRTNLILHGLAAVAFLLFALALLRRALPAAGSGRRLIAATAAAALFAVHPLRAESVAWITERRDVLSAPFFLLVLIAWLRWAGERPRALQPKPAFAVAVFSTTAVSLFFGFVQLDDARGSLEAAPGVWLAAASLATAALPLVRSGGGRPSPAGDSSGGGAWYALALAAMFISLTAKAWAIVVPAVLLVLDVWPLKRCRNRGDVIPLLVEKLPFAALTVIFAGLARWAQASQGGTMKTLAEHTLLERLLQGCYGIVWYPTKTFVPRGLAAIHELPHELGLTDPRFLVPLVIALGATALLLLRSARWPALAAAWVAFGVIVSPVLGIAQSGPQLVADRYSYLSCMPFALLVGGGWLWFAGRRPAFASAGALGLVLLTVGSLALTRAQVAHWRSDEALWERALAVDPNSYAAHLQLGKVRMEQARLPSGGVDAGKLAEGRSLFERGFELEDDPRFLEGLASYYELRAALEPELADQHNRTALDYSRQTYTLSLESDRFLPIYRFNYGTKLWNAGQYEPALEHLEWFAENQPVAYIGRYTLGLVHLAMGRPADALEHLKAAVALEPASAEARAALAQARAALGY